MTIANSLCRRCYRFADVCDCPISIPRSEPEYVGRIPVRTEVTESVTLLQGSIFALQEHNQELKKEIRRLSNIIKEAYHQGSLSARKPISKA